MLRQSDAICGVIVLAAWWCTMRSSVDASFTLKNVLQILAMTYCDLT